MIDPRQTTTTLASALIVAGMLLVANGQVLGAAPAAGTAEQAVRLDRLRTRIRSLQVRLNKTVHKRDAEREQLRELEATIGRLIHDLRQLGARLKSQARALKDLKRRRATARAKLRGQRAGLGDQLRAAYLMGRQEYVKMLLNQTDPATFTRVLTYYRYLNGARMQQIDKIESALARIHTMESEIIERSRELEALHAAQVQRKQALENARVRRTEVLALLDRRVRDQSDEIARLRLDEERLERLLEQLQQYLAGLPREPTAKVRFADRKGKLPLPTKGKIRARFGSPKKIGKMRWKGLFLSGRTGQDVVSVARGRVAFADSLRGFGLLLILEHGDGYMTLYGHNQSLYPQVGEWVEAGQVIASMGNTGNAPGAGVYFEIRENGRPRDPLQWCRLR
ncbi:MAG: murein hydrolase activator EnvC family protein [Acidiferrobacterales bacterium]